MNRYALFLFPLLVSSVGAKPPTSYLSPDGVLMAKVLWVGKGSQEGVESRIQIYSETGKMLALQDLTSADHEHGGVVGNGGVPRTVALGSLMGGRHNAAAAARR